jgi:hypothetical protein
MRRLTLETFKRIMSLDREREREREKPSKHPTLATHVSGYFRSKKTSRSIKIHFELDGNEIQFAVDRYEPITHSLELITAKRRRSYINRCCFLIVLMKTKLFNFRRLFIDFLLKFRIQTRGRMLYSVSSFPSFLFLAWGFLSECFRFDSSEI